MRFVPIVLAALVVACGQPDGSDDEAATCPSHPNECCGFTVGGTSFEQNGETMVCDSTTAGETVDCAGPGADGVSVVCDTDAGWILVATQTATTATLTRYLQEDDRYIVSLSVEALIDNPTPYLVWLDVTAAELTDITTNDVFTLEEPVVAPGWLWPCSQAEVFAIPMSSSLHEGSHTCGVYAGDPLLSVTTLEVRIPSRPYLGAALGAPVPVTIVDQ